MANKDCQCQCVQFLLVCRKDGGVDKGRRRGMWSTWRSRQLGGGRVDLALSGKGHRGGQKVGWALQEGGTGPGLVLVWSGWGWISPWLHAPLHNAAINQIFAKVKVSFAQFKNKFLRVSGWKTEKKMEGQIWPLNSALKCKISWQKPEGGFRPIWNLVWNQICLGSIFLTHSLTHWLTGEGDRRCYCIQKNTCFPRSLCRYFHFPYHCIYLSSQFSERTFNSSQSFLRPAWISTDSNANCSQHCRLSIHSNL